MSEGRTDGAGFRMVQGVEGLDGSADHSCGHTAVQYQSGKKRKIFLHSVKVGSCLDISRPMSSRAKSQLWDFVQILAFCFRPPSW